MLRIFRGTGLSLRFAREHLRSSSLGEPRPLLSVGEDDRVLAAREDEVEVAPIDRLLRPPAVDDTPFLTHEGDLLTIHAPRRPIDMRLNQGRLRRVQSSRGSS